MTKTNKRRRVVSILLVLTMLLTMVPITGVTASAAEPEWTTVNYYNELLDAVKDKKEYIRLGQDIESRTTQPDLSPFKEKDFVLDLNGKTLSLNTKTYELYEPIQAIQVIEGSLTIEDSSREKTGAITGFFGNVKGTRRDCLIFVGENGSLTLKGGTFSVQGDPFSDVLDVICCQRGSVTIKDGVKLIHPGFYDKGDEVGLDGLGYALRAEPDEGNTCQIIIDGGEFDGAVKLTGSQAENGSVQINGGTFKEDVQLLYTAEENNSDPAVTVNGGTFEDKVYCQHWPWKDRLYMPYRLNGGTFKDNLYLYADGKKDDPTGNSNIALGLDKCFGYSAVVTPGGTFTGANIKNGVLFEKLKLFGIEYYKMLLEGSVSNPVRIIPNAWGVMKSVTLDGTEINYAKDWKGTVERMDNSTAHTLKFEWYPLASELVNAGYSYRAECDRYISGNKTPTTDTISATDTEYSFTIPAGADPKVYSFDLHLNLKKSDSPYNIGIYSNEHIVKLVVNEAPPEPPAPVAHSIKITNGRGTASTTSAFAGETVTVTAKDDTANYMMFTQWYAKTAGVTFADATKQETTFVMPDCDVEVNPGFQQVSFTNQPTDSWLSSVDDSKVYFAFSQPITSWKLVNEDNTTLASGNAESAKALVAATLGPKPDKTEMTCRVIVTSNGQNFTSRTFDLKWYNVPGAPDVTVYPEGGKFVETLDVNLETPNTYWGIAYTTDGSDPYDKSGTEWLLTPSAKIVDDSTQVTISKDTTIKACLYNYEGYSNMEKFGDIVTCDFTKVELTPPVADPTSGTSFYDSLNVSLSTDIVNAKIMVSYNNGDVDDLSDPNQWKEYEPEKESITLSGSYGMHGFDAVTAIRMEHPDGYTYWVHSDKQEYLYPRISYATIADASVVGKVNKEITPVDVSITLSGDVFAEDLTAGTDVSGWFTNLPAGLTAKVKERTNYTATLVITISGTPTATSAAAISVEMPKSALRYTGTGTAVELTVLSNPKAVYNIGMDADHQHDYSGQPYLYLDPGNHYQECKADDGYNIQAHEFTPWTDNENGTHSRHCTVCKMTDGSTYTETAEHTWVWVVDQEAALDQPGKQHEECTGCHAKRSENTEIPALRDYAVTVTGGTATVAAGTPITRAMEGVEVTVTAQAPDGKHFVKWVVKAGGVTLANETSATTTFTMPSNAVKIEATYKDAPPSHTHSYGTEWKYDDTNHWHECECGDKADTAAHSFQWVIDKAATKEATGIKHEECTVCGAKRSENTVIDKLPDSGNTSNTGNGDNNTDKPGNDDSTKCPQTGDNSNHIGWLAALYVSGGVLTVLGVSSKKRKKSEAE